jgi:hypothetical protein
MTLKLRDVGAFLSRHRVLIASILLLVWYALNAAAYLVKGSNSNLGFTLERLVNRDGLYSMPEEQAIEAFEDVLWIGATILYLLVLIRDTRQKPFRVNPWVVILLALCFFACGEEMSWGYKYFHWKSDFMQRVNHQGETNIHNLHPGTVLGFPRSSTPYRVLQSLWNLQNVAFEALTFLIWVVLPTLKEKGIWRGKRMMDCVLVTGARTRILYASGIAVWVGAHLGRPLWGRYDVGEVFELTVATIAVLAAIDALEGVSSPNPAARAVAMGDVC